MAVPKKKVSRSRRNMRRFADHNRLDKVTGQNCPACGEVKRPHAICKCGSYAGRQVLPAIQAEVPAQA